MAADLSTNRAAGYGGGGGDSDPRTSAPLKVARIIQEPSGWEQGGAAAAAAEEMEFDRQSLDEWAKDKPLSILQLDPADRAVLKIAGMLIELGWERGRGRGVGRKGATRPLPAQPSKKCGGNQNNYHQL